VPTTRQVFAEWRENVREDPAFRAALLEWCRRWSTVAQAADFMRQHSAGISSDYLWLSPKDQSAVVRSILDSLVREGRMERALGPGDKFGEVLTYLTV